MRHLTIIALALSGVVLLAACGGGDGADTSDQEATTPAAPQDEQAATDDGYPLDVCLVSGEALDAMGGPHVIVHEGQTVKFCCKDCVDEFKAAPATHLATIEAATKGEPVEMNDGGSHQHDGHDGHHHEGHQH